MSGENFVPISSLSSRFDSHGLWFVLLVVQVTSSAMFFPASMLYPDAAPIVYSTSLLSVAAAYAIVLWKSFGRPRLNMTYWSTVMISENFSYFVLALSFALLRPYLLTILMPFAVYSTFHVANYTRSSLLVHPYFRYRFSPATLSAWTKYLLDVEKGIQVKLLPTAALLECLNFPILLITWLAGGGGNILGLITLFQFLRIRFAASSNTQVAFSTIGNALDTYAAHPYCPLLVRKAYFWCREKLVQWAANDQFIRSIRAHIEARETRGR